MAMSARHETATGWGRYPRAAHTVVPAQRHHPLRMALETEADHILPIGNGRSYGDSALNDNGTVIDCRTLNRILAYDPRTGIVRAEAGVMLHQIAALCELDGWFLPTTPGTQFVTLGGAVANDVHGKNHHGAGTFGCHVRAFELHRSDGSVRVCTPTQNVDWFAATIAGMGLTGLISWVEVQLAAVPGPMIEQETTRYNDLSGFFSLAADTSAPFEHTVSWMDSLSRGNALGRGIFIRGRHTNAGTSEKQRARTSLDIPLAPPISLLNRWTLKVFNTAYFHRHPSGSRQTITSPERFFYPLDRIGNWNHLYGPRGLLQHQCVVPLAIAPDVFRELIERAQRQKLGSFLTVAKTFGPRASPGMMSFPRPGATLTLDFPNVGVRVLRLLDELDCVVRAAGGAVNPYKDARMSVQTFQASFPQWRTFRRFVDPRFSSSFWRRVTAGEAAASQMIDGASASGPGGHEFAKLSSIGAAATAGPASKSHAAE